MDSLDISRFQQDLRAAMTAGLTLRCANGQPLTQSRLESLYRQVSDSIKPSDLPGQSLARIAKDDRLPQWYRSALTVFAHSSNTLPVLEGWNAISNGLQQLRMILRWNMVYLMLILAMALAGMISFRIFGIPILESFRGEFVTVESKPYSYLVGLVPWWIGWSIAVMFGLLAWMPRRNSAWLIRWLGGHRYLRAITVSAILRTTQTLLWAGLSTEQAVRLASEMMDASSSVRLEVQSLVHDTENADIIGQVAGYFNADADQRLNRIRIVAPVLICVFGGGIFSLVYACIMFVPLYYLIQDAMFMEH